MLESEIKKLTAAVAELTAAFSGNVLNTIPATPAPSQTTEETPTPAPAVAAEPAPTPVAAAVAAPVVPSPPAAPVVPEVKAPTKKQLVEKFIELAQAKDREVAVKLLADFGVSKLPELTDKAKWPEFIVAVDALLAG